MKGPIIRNDPMRQSERDFVRWDVARDERAAGNAELADRIERGEADDHFPVFWRMSLARPIHHGDEFAKEWDRLATLERA